MTCVTLTCRVGARQVKIEAGGGPPDVALSSPCWAYKRHTWAPCKTILPCPVGKNQSAQADWSVLGKNGSRREVGPSTRPHLSGGSLSSSSMRVGFFVAITIARKFCLLLLNWLLNHNPTLPSQVRPWTPKD